MEYQFKIPVNRTLNNKTGFEYRYNNIPESRIFSNPEIRKKYTVFWCFWVEQRETIFLVVSISPDKKNIILMKNMISLWRKHSSGTENPQKVIFESKIDFWEPNWKIQIFVLFQKKWYSPNFWTWSWGQHKFSLMLAQFWGQYQVKLGP